MKGEIKMTEQEKLAKLEEIMDLEEGTLKPDDCLGDYEEWDSIAVLSFIAMMDEEFGRQISGTTIKGFETVRDILKEME